MSGEDNMSSLITKSFTFNGKRYYVRASTEREALIKMANKQRDLEEGKVTVGANMTVRKWALMCFDTYKKPNVKPVTYKKYINRLENCILSIIGDMRIKDVRAIDCQRVVNNQEGNSKYQINQTVQFLNFIFTKAKLEKLIIENPAEGLVKIKGSTEKRRALTNEERKHFDIVTANNDDFMVFMLMINTGCRPSEAKEAEGRDVIIKDGYPLLHIRGTKTENSDRYVPLSKEFYNRIKNIAPFSPIAPNFDGNKMTDDNFKRRWKSLKRELNISMGCRVYRNQLVPPFPLADDLVPYCLRHTFCTDLARKGIDVRITQNLMGHSDIRTTVEIYTHVDNSIIIQAAASIYGEGIKEKQYI